ncbi:aurkb-a, partial [Symbiodinium natans]
RQELLGSLGRRVARSPRSQAGSIAELAAGPAAADACLRASEKAERTLDAAGWHGRPTWNDIHDGLRPAQCGLPDTGERCQPHFRETELLSALQPPARARLRLQAGPQAAAWLSAIPSEAASALPPDRMLIALLRRRLRLPLPVAPHRCGAHGHECGADVDAYGDHHAVPSPWNCPASRPEGQMARTPAPGIDPADRRRLDFVAS